MIVYDFECFKYNWLVVWLDLNTRKFHCIVDDKEALEKFYNYYKKDIWIGYNSRGYDQWITKAILCGFNPYEMSDWIINQDRKGHEFSKMLSKFPILNYDCSVGFRSLKELEAFQGHDIRETSVPFDIDRPLTKKEINDTIKYCKHDVNETFSVFVETHTEFESHVGLIKEFGLPISNISKTKAQISAIILGAEYVTHDDEFDIELPANMTLGKYEFVREHFLNWSKFVREYEQIGLELDISGIPHVCGIGGLHGSRDKYYGNGIYLMLDVASYYPAGMILYNFLSRNVQNPKRFKMIRDERIAMKRSKDKREAPRKIVINSSFGASKDKFNKLYDPRKANELCISCQLFLIDLIEKLEGKCELIQSNTDGILIKINKESEKEGILKIVRDWENRTGFEMECDEYSTVIQRDVNNYIIVSKDGHIKRKGAVVKELSPLDNDLPIVNKAVVDYFTRGISPEKTIMECNTLISFQKITKISGKYEYGFLENILGKIYTFADEETGKYRVYNGTILNEKVHRCFASMDEKDGSLYKKNKLKWSIDKTPSTPEHCFVINDDVTEMEIPYKLDKQWYINEANKRIREFV